jgi:hypothetical protein
VLSRSVRQNADGTTQAECDATLSDGVILRGAASDNGKGTTFDNQYQENLSASSIANAAYGLQSYRRLDGYGLHMLCEHDAD